MPDSLITLTPLSVKRGIFIRSRFLTTILNGEGLKAAIGRDS